MSHDMPGWYKSSYSGNVPDSCVEINPEVSPAVLIRDSKEDAGAIVTVSRAAWAAFAGSVAGR
ncbi:DUF397 domain-containing protein [Streptomyces sp. BI20]|uniref:DUF397 domain-containing protein n=1 Tax=Streptomyces sp. BI20 TaxID=3403460 RepID=UPI003C743E3A